MGKFYKALKKYDVDKVKKTPAVAKEHDASFPKETFLEINGEDKINASWPSENQSTVGNIGSKPHVEVIAQRGGEPNGDQRVYAKDNFDRNLVAYHAPRSYEAEQFRMLRTHILFPSDGKPSPRTILVTSALPGEGKSFVASNLAYTIAQNIDKHMLLIDCDMRRPTIHKIFGYENAPGLSNYLLGQDTLPNLLLKTGSGHLSILPGGPPPPNPAELLSSNRMLALLKEVRARYEDRYILIDSPPPHLTAESNALAPFVDGIILVVKFGKTNREQVSDLVDKFKKEKILGVVANWIDKGATNLYGSGKYNRYSYYGSQAAN